MKKTTFLPLLLAAAFACVSANAQNPLYHMTSFSYDIDYGQPYPTSIICSNVVDNMAHVRLYINQSSSHRGGVRYQVYQFMNGGEVTFGEYVSPQVAGGQAASYTADIMLKEGVRSGYTLYLRVCPTNSFIPVHVSGSFGRYPVLALGEFDCRSIKGAPGSPDMPAYFPVGYYSSVTNARLDITEYTSHVGEVLYEIVQQENGIEWKYGSYTSTFFNRLANASYTASMSLSGNPNPNIPVYIKVTPKLSWAWRHLLTGSVTIR